MSDAHDWTPEQIQRMTLAQVVVYLCDDGGAGRPCTPGDLKKLIHGMQSEAQ